MENRRKGKRNAYGKVGWGGGGGMEINQHNSIAVFKEKRLGVDANYFSICNFISGEYILYNYRVIAGGV